MDDDQSIHPVWQGRFISADISKNIEVINFTDPEEFLKFCKTEKDLDLYLIDYEFIGHKLNGLDVIASAQIFDKSILVTSRFEEEKIIHTCENKNLKLLPKGLAGFIPIEQAEDKNCRTLAVLLDDDELVRMTWEFQARKAGIELLTFATYDELLRKIDVIDMNSTFYIDSSLGDGVLGENVAQELYNKGYKKLILATGYDRDKFKSLDFIVDIIGKKAPF